MDLVQTVRKEGSRGGRGDFKWEDVKNDAQRENYLGHSVMAPVGRWQQGRDLSWYAKGDAESKEAEASRIKEEKRKLKEAEEDAMLAAMGLPVPVRNNANLTPLGGKAHEADVKDKIEEKAQEGENEDRTKRREKKERSRRHRDDDGERRRPVRETGSDATDTKTVHARARATGGEMTTEMTDVGIGQGAVNISDEKIVQNVGVNATQMADDQDRTRGIADVKERLEASLRTIEMRGGVVEISFTRKQTQPRDNLPTSYSRKQLLARGFGFLAMWDYEQPLVGITYFSILRKTQLFPHVLPLGNF
ncbi:hypothetical protein COCMIDRAFT_98970 [Bipolaris oryzae ATCC 44560]|uniref:Multiple myeloma tumor-associated protein 2-like N-terminal domain-containing protein n=1 Tax=Bipolaris oryzae ATCC 44560 TaxID=930090 RepID=W6Z2D6_COCMI|nr:uncharacterized protein COCMIDRAFT_98970 [Bipolaris oryzae ATCC 44560]EUC44140.1 hypothetical protein COCMIDRAFT_98970 [Bipolaris oryzae ATCC 44560]